MFISNTTEDICNGVTILICKRGNKFNFEFRVRLHAVAVQGSEISSSIKIYCLFKVMLSINNFICNCVNFLICERGNKFNFGFRVRLQELALRCSDRKFSPVSKFIVCSSNIVN